MRYLTFVLVGLVVVLLSVTAWFTIANARHTARVEALGLQEVSNGDAQFWLMQGPPNNRYIPCTIDYHFDQPLDESLLRNRLEQLVAPYQMFRRNIVEIDGLPYWQSVEPDWRQNFRRLSPEEDMESVRVRADAALSEPQKPGEGLPLFRAYLSADGMQLTFMWHHVISDLEGMFNKHARHLFLLDVERTRFGYQISSVDRQQESGSGRGDLSLANAFADRPLGFEQTGFEVSRIVLQISDRALHDLGLKAGLPMSDIFSFITMRTVTRYHESADESGRADIRSVVSPLSLRTSSLETDEGNNRAIKHFPLVFPLESVDEMYRRISGLAPASSSYDQAGKMMKRVRRYAFLELPFRRLVSPDYISNYFPLADGAFQMGEARVTGHDLRVPMVPYERAKFAWSNYDAEVQLFLHTDPELIDGERLRASYDLAVTEVLDFLKAAR